ncbi:hypothetical protein AB4097_20645 [Microvirga sp. 2MCAF35]|uniref:DUF6894 family protein n=1 Tax=Microvirga sp. 2MCAF35 TaxID=3232987 RepID=UPI003F9A2A22
MPRYFLHLKHADHSVIEDWEGSELPSLQAAQEEAMRGIRYLLAEAIKFGRDIAVEAIVVTDHQGRHLHSVSVKEALPERVLYPLRDADYA